MNSGEIVWKSLIQLKNDGFRVKYDGLFYICSIFLTVNSRIILEFRYLSGCEKQFIFFAAG